MRRSGAMISASDGAQIYIWEFWPDEGQEVRGVVQLLHGFGEYAGRFHEWAQRFCDLGVAFIGHDKRGHGKTPGPRGVVSSYDLLLDDVTITRAHIEKVCPGKPVILYGHSLGGGVALAYLLKRGESEYRAAISSCPWLRLQNPPSKSKERLARILGKIRPKMAISAGLKSEDFSSDPEALKRADTEKLYHGQMGVSIYPQIVEMGEYILAHAAEIKLPVLLLAGGNDNINSTPAMREFAQKARDNLTYKEFKGLRHELHNEREHDREAVFNVVWGYIAPYLG